MSVMRPRRSESSLSASLGADRKDREQIRRLLSRPQKATAAPVYSGGGIVGIAEVESISSSILHDSGGMDRTRIQYGAPWDYGISGLASAGSFCSISGNELHLTPGAYDVSVRVDYGWPAGTAAPSAVQIAIVNMGSASDGMHGGYDQLVPVVTGPLGVGVCAIVNVGPTVITDGGWLWVELSCSQPGAAGSPATGVNGDPGLHWTICKRA